MAARYDAAPQKDYPAQVDDPHGACGMAVLSNRVIDLIEAGLAQTSAGTVGRVFFEGLRDFGVNAIYARAYGMAGDVGGEHVFSRISPPGWESLYAERDFQSVNYLPREVRRRAEPFLWSQIPLLNAGERGLAQALADNGFGDGLAVPCHGPHGYVGVVSLAFERLHQVAPDERLAIQVASVILHDRMRALSHDVAPPRMRLSPRERDCLGFIAEGKSDPDIAAILGIAEATVLTHVQNARRKLGARTRAQAVGYCLVRNLL
ncbi:MAG: autoinducer binding domain-containing protein [Caulobacteraceae bacterium]